MSGAKPCCHSQRPRHRGALVCNVAFSADVGERIDPPVLIASLVGFAGVLIVVRPGGDAFQLGTLTLLGAAFFYALMMITARRYGAREHLWAMVFYMTLVPFIITATELALGLANPRALALAWHFRLGFLGIGATAFITLAFRFAPAAIAAPFDYTAMLWAVLLGWWFWGELPDLWVWVGSVLIMGSGLAIAYHDRRTTLKPRPTA